jgi:hypothetical protein
LQLNGKALGGHGHKDRDHNPRIGSLLDPDRHFVRGEDSSHGWLECKPG